MRHIMLGVALGAVVVATSGLAESPLSSLRPPEKSVFLVSADPLVRPKMRPDVSSKITKVSGGAPQASSEFAQWIDGFAKRARAAGISQATLEAALQGVAYDPDVIHRDRNQSEFTKTIWDYLTTAVSAARVSNGKAALAKHEASLRQIEAQYEVDRYIVTAIWGLESAFGAFKGSNNTIQSLATLSFDARRSAFFETQLLAALQIVQSGDVAPSDMQGSWAGAMGHTQFMPTSYLDHAVDHNGDGRRDIWGADPTDALASTAAYLKNFGWTPGQPWGVEVVLPNGFDYTQADRKIKQEPQVWAALGVRDVQGREVPKHGTASILLPAGAQGAAFMIFDNFAVIERYNPADAYVIGVGHLADRIRGGPPIKGTWPLQDRALTFEERMELQTRLTRAGFDTQKIDGKIGPLTIAAVRSWQKAHGQLPDGYASLRVLNALR